MTPFYADDWLTVYGGDCLDVMRTMPSDSVDCVVTSPPYWGLRDYGTATWEGGDAECDHLTSQRGPGGLSAAAERSDGKPRNAENRRDKDGDHYAHYRHTCGKCGAVRIDSQLGLERTPEEYVANMVAVFAEVRRVLKPSGTCWLNLGDSYASQGGPEPAQTKWQVEGASDGQNGGRSRTPGGLKPKDLVGIPWRVAFALQADGWYLRSDIIWSKPNPMPESVTDRPTKAHEYLFLLTKSARYYFDADAVREESSPLTRPGRSDGATVGKHAEAERPHQGMDSWHLRRAKPGTHDGEANGRAQSEARGPNHNLGYFPAGRNIRSVWTIATRPYPGAHFAVFPPELPERCIKAGSSEKGVCPECGAPWERVTIKPTNPDGIMGKGNGRHLHDFNVRAVGVHVDPPKVETIGWRLACAHTGTVPAVVLDPFAGSGTVGMVANRLSRRAILIDLNPEYLKQQMKRNAQTPLGLDVA